MLPCMGEDPKDETEYLLGGEANASRLNEAMAQAKAGETVVPGPEELREQRPKVVPPREDTIVQVVMIPGIFELFSDWVDRELGMHVFPIPGMPPDEPPTYAVGLGRRG